MAEPDAVPGAGPAGPPARWRWLVTGAGGMLGRDLVAVLAGHPDVALTALDHAGLDVTDPDAVAVAVAGRHLVINAAGWTDVDGAESHESAATRVNGTAVATLARCCAAAGTVLLQVSSDYVFAGDATRPYPEHAAAAPVNAYGRGKLAGEQAVRRYLPERGYLVRTAWLYGEYGRNFVATMLRLAGRQHTVDVVADQYGQPTWSLELARRLAALGTAALVGAAPAGIYHGTASGQTTWYGLARQVFSLAGLDPARVRPTTSAAYPRAARRPSYSVLGHAGWAAAGLAPMAPWQDALREALGGPAFAALIPARQPAARIAEA
jgi:dTDP-4-dehydrorhamnose reductase